MPGRGWGGVGYRYGFNGKETDNDVKGTGNQYDYGFRIYDPRIGKFLSVDPLAKSYPWYTPYQFAGNKPIAFLDLDGAEEYHYLRFKDDDGNTVLAFLGEEDIVEQVVTKRSLGRGGNLPTKSKTVTNRIKIYVVNQESEYEYDNGAYFYNYVEDVAFKTPEEAAAATDNDFALTDDDYYNKIGSGFDYYTEGMTDWPSAQWHTADFGGGKKGGVKGRGGLKSAPRGIEFHLHHLISKGLGKTSAFVQKAIQGGFKLNGKMNLTPVERFIKKFGTGVHAKHTKYTSQIKDFLEGLDLNKFTPEKAKNLLQTVNRHIIKKIKDNPGVKLNDLNLDLKSLKF